MKKLYKKSSSVHPLISDHHLSLLPAAIFSLTLALSQQDKQVLAYLLSSSSTNNNKTNKKTKPTTTSAAADHPPVFTCKCFSCYMSYWALWDSSPNRQLIHDIIDAFEDTSLLHKNKTKKDRKKKPSAFVVISNSTTTSNEEETELTRSPPPSLNEFESVVAECEEKEEEQEEEEEKGSVRKLVNFLGERIWSVWT